MAPAQFEQWYSIKEINFNPLHSQSETKNREVE